MGNGKRRENRAGILVSVSGEENEIVVDNLDAARSHTYLSVTCVHGECTDDPYAWCNDGTARIRGGLSQKGLENVQTLRGVGGLFFSVGQFHAWNVRKLQKEREETGGITKTRIGRTDYDINDRFKNLFTTKLLSLARERCLTVP